MDKTLKISKKFLNVEKPDGKIVKIFLRRLKVSESGEDIVKIEEQIHKDYDSKKISELDFFKKKFELLTDNFDFNDIIDLATDDMIDIILSLKELSMSRRTLEEKKSQG